MSQNDPECPEKKEMEKKHPIKVRITLKTDRRKKAKHRLENKNNPITSTLYSRSALIIIPSKMEGATHFKLFAQVVNTVYTAYTAYTAYSA